MMLLSQVPLPPFFFLSSKLSGSQVVMMRWKVVFAGWALLW